MNLSFQVFHLVMLTCVCFDVYEKKINIIDMFGLYMVPARWILDFALDCANESFELLVLCLC